MTEKTEETDSLNALYREIVRINNLSYYDRLTAISSILGYVSGHLGRETAINLCRATIAQEKDNDNENSPHCDDCEQQKDRE